MRLRYVVIDELHVLRGIFGTHVAHLLRRLRRLCARYGSIADVHLHVGHHRRARPRWRRRCAGCPCAAVTDDGSPRGERLFALWNPPLLDADTGARGLTERRGARR